MTVLQRNFRTPVFNLADRGYVEGMTEHVNRNLKHALFDELDKHLAKTPGGVLLGPIQITRREDRLFETPYITFQASAVIEDLPVPPEYRLFGGPADGAIVRTVGQRYFYVPLVPRINSAMSYVTDIFEREPQRVAVYERQGGEVDELGTGAYFYLRTEDQ